MTRRKNLLIAFLTIAALACSRVDETRLNQIGYSVVSNASLPVDTASRFNVFYLNEAGNEDSLMGVHRFSYSFSVEGEGNASIQAVSLDSVSLTATITQNGKVIGEQAGFEPVVTKTFK